MAYKKIISTSIRLTVDEWLTLKRKAWKARMSLSDYLVSKAAGRPPSGKYWRERFKAY